MNFKPGTFTTPANNWTGEDITYTISADGVLTYRAPHGDQFTLHHTVEVESNVSTERIRVAYLGDPDSEVFSASKVTFYGDMAKYNDELWMINTMDIERWHKDPVAAIVQMLGMTY